MGRERAECAAMKKPFYILLVAVLLTGCERDELTVYRTPKEARTVPTGMELPSGHPNVADAAAAPMEPSAQKEEAASAGVLWTLPPTWREEGPAGMRRATFRPPAGEGTEVSVIVLPGAVGGMLANVNRWRGQIGLAAISESELPAAVTRVSSAAGDVSVVDFSSATGKERVFAGVLNTQGEVWFFKAMGPNEAVSKVKEPLLGILKSLRHAAP
jgi:hypothetical protein